MVDMYVPRSAAGYTLENVWQTTDISRREEIIAFWLKEGAVRSREEGEKRVSEVVLVARSESDNAIAGICTVVEEYAASIESWLYFYRSYTAKEHRKSAIATELLLGCRDFFNGNYKEGDYICGLAIVVQNRELREGIFAIGKWVGSDMVYMGKTPTGEHVRVCYFDMASLFVPKPAG